MSSIVLVTTHWPLVFSRLPERVELATLDAYFERFEREVLARAEPFASVLDMTPLSHLPAARTRQRAVEWSQEFEAAGLLWNRGTALVTPNPIARAVMTSLHWLVPPKIPTTYEPDLPHAIRWAVGRLSAAGLAVGPAEELLAELDPR